MSGCGGGTPAAIEQPAVTPLGSLAMLGEQLYKERFLSGSGRMSCATCHDPAFSHGPPNAQAVQVGGAFETQFGLRAAPSLRYLERQPVFDLSALHGGLMADGRVDTLAAQVRLPLLNPLELESGGPARLVRIVGAANYGPQFRAQFGEPDEATVLAAIGTALQAFQLEDARFHPYDSKFDLVVAGRERFSAAEVRGLAAFNDPARGNCAACHTSSIGSGGKPPLFTNFGYAATGVARNPLIPANADASYFDLGLCQRPELAGRAELCGLFRTPSLRNVE
ncbi:MAG TPA: cytochrome c peroxidase, partial [Burkholderiaceae bacterium]